MLQIEPQQLDTTPKSIVSLKRSTKLAKKQQLSIPSQGAAKAVDSWTEKSPSSDKSENTSFRVPTFLAKVYELVDDASNRYIFWNRTNDGFIVQNANKFSEEVLPHYFKTNQFASFVRQLNLYNFTKTKTAKNQHCFSHPFFLRGRKELLEKITKKDKVKAQKENCEIAPYDSLVPAKRGRSELDESYLVQSGSC